MNNKHLTPFIAPSSTIPVTQEEVNRRMRMIARAEELGIYLTMVDSNNQEGYENPYKIQALGFIIQDQEVPEELKKKIIEFEKQQIIMNEETK